MDQRYSEWTIEFNLPLEKKCIKNKQLIAFSSKSKDPKVEPHEIGDLVSCNRIWA